MISEVEQRRSDLTALCRKYGVRRLEIFGSAAVDEAFDPARSDLDFLVEFDRTDEMGPADQYFGLWEELKELFGREVDLSYIEFDAKSLFHQGGQPDPASALCIRSLRSSWKTFVMRPHSSASR